MSLLGELKRRNVFRVGVAYVALSWLIIQIIEVPFSFDEMQSRNQPDSLRERNIHVMSSQGVTIAGHPGRLLYVEEEMRGSGEGEFTLARRVHLEAWSGLAWP